MISHGKNMYYPQLDTLRFIAFVLVFFHHTPQISTLPFFVVLKTRGWIGVDLFLCLSAFLFVRLLFAEYQAQGDIDVRKFYIRRLLRIWPLYFVFLGVIFFTSLAGKGWDSYTILRSLGMMTFTENIFAAFASYNRFRLSTHLWTISYEEQFYAVIPWTLRKVFRMTHKSRLIFVSAVFVIGMSIKAAFIYFNISHPAIWVLPITHFESILGGLIIGLGIFDEHLKKIPPYMIMLLGIATLVFVAQMPDVTKVDWHLMFIYPLIGIGMSLVIYSALVMEYRPVKMIFQNGILAHLGKVSYGLYVYHLLGIYLGTTITQGINISPERLLVYPLMVMAIGLGITILISLLSYQFLEKPFLKIKDRFALIQTRPV